MTFPRLARFFLQTQGRSAQASRNVDGIACVGPVPPQCPIWRHGATDHDIAGGFIGTRQIAARQRDTA